MYVDDLTKYVIFAIVFLSSCGGSALERGRFVLLEDVLAGLGGYLLFVIVWQTILPLMFRSIKMFALFSGLIVAIVSILVFGS